MTCEVTVASVTPSMLQSTVLSDMWSFWKPGEKPGSAPSPWWRSRHTRTIGTKASPVRTRVRTGVDGTRMARIITVTVVARRTWRICSLGLDGHEREPAACDHQADRVERAQRDERDAAPARQQPDQAHGRAAGDVAERHRRGQHLAERRAADQDQVGDEEDPERERDQEQRLALEREPLAHEIGAGRRIEAAQEGRPRWGCAVGRHRAESSDFSRHPQESDAGGWQVGALRARRWRVAC